MNKNNLLILLLSSILSATIGIKLYQHYIEKDKIETMNKLWSNYAKHYQEALKITLNSYNDTTTANILQKHIDKEAEAELHAANKSLIN